MTDNGNGDNNHDPKPNIVLMAERQRQHAKRLAEIEKKQAEAEKLVNRYMGGIAIIIGVGVFIGWLVTLGSGVFQIFRR